MEYNKVNLFTFFYVLVWRHVVRFVTHLTEGVSDKERAYGARKVRGLIKEGCTPEMLSAWYRSNSIEYKAERFDNVRSPEGFLKNLGGDCDDFAEFAMAVLPHTGWNTRRVYVSGKEGAHVFTVAEKDGKYFINDTYACYPVENLYEACNYFAEDGYTEYILL